MDIINDISNILKAREFVKTKNYYFHNHICQITKNNEKVLLSYKITLDDKKDAVKIGKCIHCNKAFYREDFDSKSI